MGLASMRSPHECWMQKPRYNRRGSYSKAWHLVIDSASLLVSKEATTELIGVVSRATVLSPTGNLRNLWDCVGICCLLMDVIFLPVQFIYADLYSDYPALAAFSKFEVAFWLCDIILCFFTGYSERGILVGNRSRIARRYLKTWFFPDVIVTTVDLAIEFGIGARFEASGSTRVLRLLRLMRVVRLGKVTRFAAFLRDRFETEGAYTHFSLLLVMLSMMLIEHVIACGWFGLAPLSSSNTWITRPRSW